MSKKRRICENVATKLRLLLRGEQIYSSVDVQVVPARPCDKGRLHTKVTDLNYIQK